MAPKVNLLLNSYERICAWPFHTADFHFDPYTQDQIKYTINLDHIQKALGEYSNKIFPTPYPKGHKQSFS